MPRKPMDMSVFSRDSLTHLAEGGMCVHSVYIPNCAGCKIRELERMLAIVIDTHEGKFGSNKPMHGFVFPSENDVWQAARATLERAEADDH